MTNIEDKTEKKPNTAKIAGLLALLIMTGSTVMGLLDKQESKESIEKRNKAEQIKNYVLNYVDANKDGRLSNRENYSLKCLMGIEDSSKDYSPREIDWERTYNKIKNE